MELGMHTSFLFVILILILKNVPLVAPAAKHPEVGVCYGTLGNNLPPARSVVALLRRCNILNVRVYEPHPDLMDALSREPHPKRNLHLGVRNQDLQSFASNFAAAKAWVDKYYAPYAKSVPIPEVIVGNEVVPGENAPYLVPAMRNLWRAFGNRPPRFLTTALSAGVLTNTYPPSQGIFRTEVMGVMQDLVQFLLSLPRPKLYIHLYPYFAYADDPVHVSLKYALFQSRRTVVVDRGLRYSNLFDAMYDSYAWAMEKIGGGGVKLVVGETGWPSAGNGNFTSPKLARIYHTNLFNHLTTARRTPKVADLGGAFVFALFNENQKPGGVEQNWGLFYPNRRPVYYTPLCSK